LPELELALNDAKRKRTVVENERLLLYLLDCHYVLSVV
jgi:hypothetical protein